MYTKHAVKRKETVPLWIIVHFREKVSVYISNHLPKFIEPCSSLAISLRSLKESVAKIAFCSSSGEKLYQMQQ